MPPLLTEYSEPRDVAIAAVDALEASGRSKPGLVQMAWRRIFQGSGRVDVSQAPFDTRLPSLSKDECKLAQSTTRTDDEARLTNRIYGDICPAFRKSRPRETVLPVGLTTAALAPQRRELGDV